MTAFTCSVEPEYCKIQCIQFGWEGDNSVEMFFFCEKEVGWLFIDVLLLDILFGKF